MDIRANTSIERGGLRCLWHPAESHLRHIHAGEVEILRGVYFALRTADWGTVVPVVRDAGFGETAGGWRLWQDLHWREDIVDFAGHLEIEAAGSTLLRFRFEGMANATFRSNRIGFLVLHAAECAGGAVSVEKTNGIVVDGQFPAEIAPWQPFTDIRAITHAPADGVKVRVLMEGEAFELEDQRNWTDASFKTYSTPLSLPFPRLIEAGTRVAQEVTVSIQGAETAAAEEEGRVIKVSANGGSGGRPFPKLGFEDAPGEPVDKVALRALQPDHLRAEVHADQPDPLKDWRAAAARAKEVGAAMETALFLDGSDPEGISRLVEALLQVDTEHARWLVFDVAAKVTPAVTLAAVGAALARTGVEVALFSGTDAFFTEINRERPPLEGAHGVVFSSNPSVHAIDDLSLVETLKMLGLCVENAARFGAGMVCVSPLTFKMRRNPNATTPEGGYIPVEKQVDPRQGTPWGAAWTLGALKYLAEAGAGSVTCFKTGGPTGLFPSADAVAGSPPADLFRALVEWREATVVDCESTAPLKVEALYLQRGDERAVFAANLSDRALEVSFSWNGGATRRTLTPGVTWFVMESKS